jgi:hypothetical protein
MIAKPGDHKEWLLLVGAAVGGMLALAAGWYAFVFVAVGIVVGLLFAPRPGWATRRELVAWASRIAAPDDPPADDKTY